MKNVSDDPFRKIRHDFKMGVEELLSAISLHGENDGREVDSDDSQEVLNTLKKMKLIWGQLERAKKGEKCT